MPWLAIIISLTFIHTIADDNPSGCYDDSE